MTDTTENQTIVDVAQEAVRAQQLERGIYYDGLKGELVDIRDELHEEAQRAPDRKTGRYTVTDPASFVGYLAKHGEDNAEVWANVNTGTVRAVLNAHGGDPSGAGHEDHTLTLQLATTDDWKHWLDRDGKLLPQLVFAEFIEDHLPNFQNPSAADMLELAQTFQASSKGEFASSQRVKSGETALTWSEQHEAKAGAKGQIAIPDTFTIALQPFEGGPAYKIEARFRYRIEGGTLALGYRLTRPKDVRKAAFTEVVDAISDDTGRAIWATTA